MLRSIGHHEVRLLDGGYQAWVERGGPVETGPVSVTSQQYPGPVQFTGVTTHDQIEDRRVIDARAPERYRGDHEPIDPRPGRIPGSLNIPTGENLDRGGLFLNPSRLAAVYSEVPDDAVVSCGSGVTACHDALAMVVAGRPMPDVYVGSYSEWSRRDLPVETG